MKQRHLQPGMYLVGRDDGRLDPFFVMMEPGQMSCHPSVAALMDHAYAHPGWWWEPMLIPSHLSDRSFHEEWTTPETDLNPRFRNDQS